MHISSFTRAAHIQRHKSYTTCTNPFVCASFVVLLTTTFIHIRMADCITAKLCIRLHLLSSICTCRTIFLWFFVCARFEFIVSSPKIYHFLLLSFGYWFVWERRISSVLDNLRFRLSIAWIWNIQLVFFLVLLQMNHFKLLHETEQRPLFQWDCIIFVNKVNGFLQFAFALEYQKCMKFEYLPYL